MLVDLGVGQRAARADDDAVAVRWKRVNESPCDVGVLGVAAPQAGRDDTSPAVVLVRAGAAAGGAGPQRRHADDVGRALQYRENVGGDCRRRHAVNPTIGGHRDKQLHVTLTELASQDVGRSNRFRRRIGKPAGRETLVTGNPKIAHTSMTNAATPMIRLGAATAASAIRCSIPPAVGAAVCAEPSAMSRRRVDIVDYRRRDRTPGRPWENKCLDATDVLASPIIVPSGIWLRNGGHRFRCRALQVESSRRRGVANAVVHHGNPASLVACYLDSLESPLAFGQDGSSPAPRLA